MQGRDDEQKVITGAKNGIEVQNQFRSKQA